jgi:hypothetical protein
MCAATKQDRCLECRTRFSRLCEYRQEQIGHFSIEDFVFLHSCRLTSQPHSSNGQRNTLRNTAIGSNVPEPLSGAEVAQRIDMSFATVVDRVRMEFVEMPEMELTLPQAVRLWSLGMDDCRFVIDSLVDAGFLAWTPKRTIVRKGRDPLSRQEMQTDIFVPVAKRYNKSV